MPVLTCPHCHLQGRAPARLAGHYATCNRCKHKVRVPGRAAPPVPEPEEPDEPGVSVARVFFGFLRALAWGGCAALTGLVGYHYFRLVRDQQLISLVDRLDMLLVVVLAFVLARCVDGITRW
jgi:hypothetical protein